MLQIDIVHVFNMQQVSQFEQMFWQQKVVMFLGCFQAKIIIPYLQQYTSLIKLIIYTDIDLGLQLVKKVRYSVDYMWMFILTIKDCMTD